MIVFFKKLVPEAVEPTKAPPTDAGFDLVATSAHVDGDGCLVIGSGIATEIPEGYVGLLFPRSSVAKKNIIMSNCVGVIDCHYRGEIMAKFKPTDLFEPKKRQLKKWITGWLLDRFIDHTPALVYGVGDKFAQLVIVKLPEVRMVEAEKLSDTDRGDGGYGSTGR